MNKTSSKLSIDNPVIGSLLNGGLDKDIITSVYGPAASGKTTFCLLTTISASKEGKVIFVDTEGGFSTERLKQLSKDYNKILKNVRIFRPTRFNEQEKVFDELNKLILQSKNNDFSLVIVDTISFLYRVEKNSENIYELNRKLGKQINLLNEIARKKHVPILLTNQVYADFNRKDRVKIVGGDLIKYASKCMIELNNLNNGLREATLIKHRSLPEKKILFEIREEGFVETKRNNKFRIF